MSSVLVRRHKGTISDPRKEVLTTLSITSICIAHSETCFNPKAVHVSSFPHAEHVLVITTCHWFDRLCREQMWVPLHSTPSIYVHPRRTACKFD